MSKTGVQKGKELIALAEWVIETSVAVLQSESKFC